MSLTNGLIEQFVKFMNVMVEIVTDDEKQARSNFWSSAEDVTDNQHTLMEIK
jgi:hypothetical protein